MASTENKLDFKDGEVDVASAGTAVALASSTTLVRHVVIQAKGGNSQDVLVGASTVVGASGATRRGTRLAANETLTIDVDNAESQGLRGARAGEGFIDMSEIFIDSPSSTPGVSWFGYA